MATLVKESLKVSSSAFGENKMIPSLYSCEGKNINPPLKISGLPSTAKSLAIIVDDPDAPKSTFVHWVVWNINPITSIDENFVSGVEGNNGAGKMGYTGPCPPSGTHHYHFKVYALDTMLDLKAGADDKSLLNAMDNHIVGYGELIGLYAKSGNEENK